MKSCIIPAPSNPKEKAYVTLDNDGLLATDLLVKKICNDIEYWLFPIPNFPN